MKCCDCRKDGVQAAYRNDQRQEYVNNVAYKHGTGLGTAPWYGVPGTAYDFGNSKSAGPTYHTDTSHPTGYGYEAPVSQYHSQPAYGHSAGSDYKQSKEVKSAQCSSDAEQYDIQRAKAAATGYNGHPADRPYSMAIQTIGYNNANKGYAGRGKVGLDEPIQPAGYVSGRYEAVGYGYMY